MKKPQPKQELFIRDSHSGYLDIYCYTPDAHEWIESAAPEFGHLSPIETYLNRRALFVHPVFDVLEVKAYLESMEAGKTE